MTILSIRTDKPEAELALFSDEQKLAECDWLADRQLSKTLLSKIAELLKSNKLELKDLKGLVVFQGPGSFTGLRIGIATANALSYGLDIAIVGADGKDWQKSGISKLTQGQNEGIVEAKYGALPHITKPRK